MAMTRRNFIEAGIGGAAALTVAQGASHADSLDSGRGFTVIGVDGSSLTVPYLNDYLRSGATVWQYSGSTIDFQRFALIQKFVDDNSSKITLAKSYADILAAKRACKIAMVVGTQEMWPVQQEWKNPNGIFPNQWFPNPPQTTLFDYYDRGLRIGNLAYNLSTTFGGGCLDPTTPLSRAGRYLVKQMQEIGILVDCSHSSEQTSLDIIRMATRPVVCSHSNVVALNDNPRNVSNRVIEGIAKTGGLIGLVPINAFLRWRRQDAPFADSGPFPALANISQYVDVIDYVRRLVGIDHVGIGGDFTLGNPANPDIEPPPSQLFAFPPEMIYNQPHGIEYVPNFKTITDLPVLRAELARHGYSYADIAKICGGNWMRVFRQAWNA